MHLYCISTRRQTGEQAVPSADLLPAPVVRSLLPRSIALPPLFPRDFMVRLRFLVFVVYTGAGVPHAMFGANFDRSGISTSRVCLRACISKLRFYSRKGKE